MELLWSKLRPRLWFLGTAVLTGGREASRLVTHHTVVGIVLMLAILGISVTPLLGVWYGVSLINGIIVVAAIVFNGAYVEWRNVKAGEQAALEALAEPVDRDGEIIASLSEQTRQRFTGWSQQLAQGDLSTRMFEEEVVAELQEHGLATIVDVGPGPKAISLYAVPHLRLTADGARILRKMKR